MAGTAKYTAVLDACVLYPVTIADILIQLAIEGLFTAKWSTDIDREWTTSLKKDRPDLTDEQINYRQQNLHKAILDWEIDQSKYQYLIANLTLPDLNDRHVLAAAIIGQADCIITSNLKDFPSDKLTALSRRI
jgi:predicted nucleic acid-binding protein